MLALDQGTTSSRAIVIDAAGRIRGSASEELPQVYPAPGEVEHDPEAIWTTQLDTARRALADAGADAVVGGRDRPDEPARDDDRLGPRDRPAGRQRDRLAEPGDGAALRRAPGGRPRAAVPGAHRPPDRRLLQRAQDRRDPRSRSGPPGAGRAGRARLRHGRRVPHLAADRRPGPRHRRVEREPDAPVRHPPAGLGPGAVRDRRGAAGDAPGGPPVVGDPRRDRSRRCSGRRSRSPAVPATSRRRRSARPASSRGPRRRPTAPARSCS